MSRRFVSFTLGEAGYCVPVENVLQIFRQENILETPKASPFVKGVISLRGDVLPVIDLGRRVSFSPREPGGAKRRILVLQFGARSYGLMVDEVAEIVDFEDDAIDERAEGLPEFVRALARRAGSVTYVLDLAAVFSIEREGSASAGGAAV